MNKRKLVLFLPLLLLVSALIPAAVNGVPTVTLSPSDDSYVCGNNGDAAKDANYGTAEFIEVHHAYQMNAFLQFDLSTIPTGSTILSAVLKLYSQLGADDVGIAGYRVDGSWDETTITWNFMPLIESTSSTSSVPPSSNPWTFDVKSDVQLFVTGTANHGWCLIIGGGQTTWRTFASKEYSGDPSTRPVLVVTYTPSNFPLPEYTYGALLAMVGCFAAFAVIKRPHLNLRRR